MAFCGNCGASVADGTTICSACGKTVGAAAAPAAGGAPAAAAPAASSGGLTANVAGALAYIWILAVIWLLIEPYKNDKFVRFHSFQSLFLCAGAIAFAIVWTIFSILLAIMHLGFLTLIGPLIWLAYFVLWIYTVYQAYSNKVFKLPVIGDLAAKQAGI